MHVTLTSSKALKHLFAPLSLANYVISTDTEAVVMAGGVVFSCETTKDEAGSDRGLCIILAGGSVINVHSVVANIWVLIGDVEGERLRPSEVDRSGVD